MNRKLDEKLEYFEFNMVVEDLIYLNKEKEIQIKQVIRLNYYIFVCWFQTTQNSLK
jgi:hypothetical protein